jgi:hypothetical protein
MPSLTKQALNALLEYDSLAFEVADCYGDGSTELYSAIQALRDHAVATESLIDALRALGAL